MDKLMDNPWFIKILALVLAILLYSSVSHTGKNNVYVPGDNATEYISDVPVKVYYDTENLVVSGIPETVGITLKGPITHVQTAKALRNFEIYADLTNAKVGKQTVKLKVRNLSDRIKATIKPETVNVTVEEKITQSFKVDTEYNRNQIRDGYSAESPIVDPKKVKITGAKSVIDKVSYVKAVLGEISDLNETVTRQASVQVLDKNLNKLNVTVEPKTVKVTIPVKANSKTVPIKIVKNGTPQEGVTIDSITLDTKEATIMANEDVLKNTDSVRVEVDVSKVTENTTMNLPVIISNGVLKVDPQMVKVSIAAHSQTEKTISGIPITIKGLNEKDKAEITDPADQKIDLTVDGPSTELDTLGPEDFSATIDVSDLDEGTHQVNIQVDGPSDVKWKPDKSTANITITNNA